VTTTYPPIPAPLTSSVINRGAPLTFGHDRKAVVDTMSLAQLDGGQRK
jgi:hypothetical protein